MTDAGASDRTNDGADERADDADERARDRGGATSGEPAPPGATTSEAGEMADDHRPGIDADADPDVDETEAHTPPGWDNNPSSWSERLPLIALAAVGVLISAYLSLFQFGVIAAVWEPFFGNGSETILTSKTSHVLPIPDAALGALSYLLDVVTGAIGGRERWRTRPWIVIVFGLAVGPLGAVSVLLVILQPVLYDAWCTLCLTSALISLVMIAPALDEMLASLQYLRAEYDEDNSLWRAFWKGTRREGTTGWGA